MSNRNPDRCNRQGIFSFFRRKLKNDRFFLVFLSNSDPRELVSDWDSSSTVGGRSDCKEGLEGMVVSAEEANEDTLALALFGRGGLAERTDPAAPVTVSGGAAALPSTETAAAAVPDASELMTFSETDE